MASIREAIPVVQQRGVETLVVLLCIEVTSAVAPVIEDEFGQPLEYAASVLRIGDPGGGAPAEQGRLVLFRDHAPSDLAGGLVRPSFDA